MGAVVAVDGEPQAVLVSGAAVAEKVVQVTGADGRKYLLAANFGSGSVKLALPVEATRAEVLSGPKPTEAGSGAAIELAPGEAALIRLRA